MIDVTVDIICNECRHGLSDGEDVFCGECYNDLITENKLLKEKIEALTRELQEHDIPVVDFMAHSPCLYPEFAEKHGLKVVRK